MNIFDLQATISLNGDSFMSGVQQAQGAFSGLGSSISAGAVAIGNLASSAITAAGSAVVGFGKDAIQTGMSFESGMSQVAATLGMTTADIANNVNGAGDTFDALKAKAAEMGRETTFSAAEAADGLNILAMSGFSAQDSIAMVEDVLHLAAAGSMDMASAAGYISGAMKGFKDETKDSGYYADLMAKGATLANTSVSQLGEAMSSGAAGAAAYSQSAESMTIALLRLAEQGEVGSAAGTSLSAAMKNLYTPTDQARDALEQLGIAAYDETGKARDFNTIVNELSASLSGMTEEEANNYKQTIFGIQGLNAYNKMTVTGTEKQAEWSAALAGASDGMGEAAKQYDTMTANLEGALAGLDSAFDGLKNSVYEKLSGPLQDAAKTGADALNSITAGFESGGIKGAISSLGSFVKSKFSDMWANIEIPDALSGVVDFLSGMKDKLAPVGDAIRDAAAKVAENGSRMLETVRGLFGSIRDAVSGIDFSAVFSTVADTIGSVIDTLRPMAEEKIEKIKGIFESLQGLFGNVVDAFSGFDTGVFSGISERVQELVEAFQKFGQVKFDAVATAIQTFIDALASADIGGTAANIAKAVGELVDAFIGVSADIISGVADAISGFMDSLGSSGIAESVAQLAVDIGDFLAVFVGASAELIESIGDGISAFFSAFDNVNIGATIGGLVKEVSDFLGAFVGASADIIEGIAGAVKDLLDGFVNSDAMQYIAGITKNVGEFIGVFVGVTGDIISSVGDGVRDFLDAFPSEEIGAIIGKIAENASDLFGAFRTVGGNVIEEIATAIKGFIDAIPKEAIAGIISDVAGAIGDLFGHFTGVVVTIVQAIGEKFEGFGQTIADLWAKAAPAFEQMGNKFHEMVEVIREAADALFKALEPVIKWIAEIFAQGIRSAIEAIVASFEKIFDALGSAFDGVRELFQGFVDLINGDGVAAGEHFKQAWEDVKAFFEKLGDAFIGIGRDIVEGLKRGISDAWESLTGWLSDKVNSLTAGVKSLFGIHSPSTVFASIGENLVKGLEVGWNSEFGSLEQTVYDDISELVSDVGKIGFEKSAIGKSSEAGISSFWTAYAGGRDGTPYEINLVLDGDVAAKALYDPLRRRTAQRGEGALNYA